MAEHNEIGKLGEEIACNFLIKQGFSIIDTNYHSRYGEIDIIAEKDSKLRFVEVKSVKVKNIEILLEQRVTPEDNLTFQKWRKIILTLENYLKHKAVPHETRYQVDLACVYIETKTRSARVKLLENIYKE
jgi:putative endonuclease